MEIIKRDVYLNKIINSENNGMIKVITGIRRCGKSFLLDPLFKNYLLDKGIDEEHIIKLDLDERKNKKYLDPDVLDNYIREKIVDDKMYYVLLDEVQKVSDFESVLNGFLHINNLDVYVTGSNSKFLSSDIISEFRGRGDEIKVYPLSFKEFVDAYDGNKYDAWNEYIVYGGMPNILTKKNDEQKSKYLKDLFNNTYINDIIERYDIGRSDALDSTIDILSSSVGSLSNPLNIANTFKSKGMGNVSRNTIEQYINYLIDAFMINKVERYDIKGKKYISSPCKYYFTDIGLRNARLNFRQIEQNHLMENIIYNELVMRGYNVDVGVIEQYGKDKDKTVRRQYEIDFVCNLGSKRYYIQSALNIDDEDKKIQEIRPFTCIDDFFKKIIIVKDDTLPYYNENGILIIGIKDFLLDNNSLEI